MQAKGHISDRDLIMAADGELPSRRRSQVAGHLDACWSCRERMQALDGTISEFVRAQNHEWNAQAPSAAGPRALLRARLEQITGATVSSSCSYGRWRGAVWQIAPATIAFLTIFAAVVMIFEAKVSAEGPKPKAGLTPGETRPITISEICHYPDAEVVSVSIPEETRRKVFSEYGINPRANNFEVDFLITPDLGGASSIRNLWPQPYTARWNAHVKDQLEQRLHQLVCDGKVDLATAQHDIAADWIGAYKKYLGESLPR